jgi:hypothetical protein
VACTAIEQFGDCGRASNLCRFEALKRKTELDVMRALVRSTCGLSLLAVLFLTACASAGTSVQVTAEATGSPYFNLERPLVYKAGDGLALAGRVCRRARGTLLSPPRVRLEHVGVAGQVLDVAHAGVPEIYRRADQACSDYSARVGWSFVEGGDAPRLLRPRASVPRNARRQDGRYRPNPRRTAVSQSYFV